MALMERVGTLLRANINDLLDRTENPEKMLRQLVLDMENQLLQVKTQVAIALADQHMLEGRVREQEEAVALRQRKTELLVGQRNDALARAALERALDQDRTLGAVRSQVADQTAETEALRIAYAKLCNKLLETRARIDVLIA